MGPFDSTAPAHTTSAFVPVPPRGRRLASAAGRSSWGSCWRAASSSVSTSATRPRDEATGDRPCRGHPLHRGRAAGPRGARRL